MMLRKVKPDEKALRSALLDDLQKTLSEWSTQQTKAQVGKLRAPAGKTDATPTEAAAPGAPVVDGIKVESVQELPDAGADLPADGPEGMSGAGTGEDDGKVPGLGAETKIDAADEGESTGKGTDIEDEKRSLEDIIRGLGKR